MGEVTKIAWTDHTFNPWIGCSHVSPGCDNCYAEALDHRWGHERWGPGAPREMTTEHYWKQPIKWNLHAQAEGVRRRVFCASLADIFDKEAPHGGREQLYDLVKRTPHLDWLFLTKRTGLIRAGLPADWGQGWPNVWLGTTVEDQRRADERIPELLDVPAVVHFLSCEPLLEDVSIRPYLRHPFAREPHCEWCEDCIPSHSSRAGSRRWQASREDTHGPFIDWVIIGGESGGTIASPARPFDPRWAGSLILECGVGQAAPFVKQLGKVPVGLELHHPKGEDPSEWPPELRIREFPTPRRIDAP